MNRSIQISGPAGSGKSTFALSGVTEEIRCSYHELDPGSYGRAAVSLGQLRKQVELYEYEQPFDALTGSGEVQVSNRGNPMPQFLYDLAGWISMWDAFRKNYVAGVQAGSYPVIDTETELWSCIRNAVQEEMQVKNLDDKALSRLKFTEPNDRMTSVIKYAKAKKMDIVLVAHEKEIWVGNEASGEYGPDGWKHTAGAVDVALRFKVKNRLPVATITKAAAGSLNLMGMELTAPTIPMVKELLDAAEYLVGEGIPVPTSYEDVLKQAKLARG